MSIAILRRDVENKLDEVDPIGRKIRQLKSRLIYLEGKKSVNAKEYKEISTGWLQIKELEQQRKDYNALSSTLDKRVRTLLRLGKNYERISQQYDAGKLDPALYAMALGKLVAEIRPRKPAYTPTRFVINNTTFPEYSSLTANMVHMVERLLGVVLIFVIVIPALFACHAH